MDIDSIFGMLESQIQLKFVFLGHITQNVTNFEI